MKDLAQELDVSVVTISKAMSDKDDISADLKEQIRLKAKELGYQINTVARSMKTGFSYNIGIVVSSYFFNKTNSFYLYYFACIIEELETHDYYGILHVATRSQRKELVMPRFCEEKSVDGIIILGQMNKEYTKKITELNIPTIFSDFYEDHEDTIAIVSDNFYSAYELTEFLIEKGHKKIGFVGNIHATSSIQDRYLGFCKALLKNKLENNPNWLVSDREETEIGIFTEFLIGDDLPTAYVCNSDGVAYHFIRFLQEKGIDVPNDVSVVCFDNTLYSDISKPKITCLETNVKEMAKISVDHLMNLVKRNSDATSGKIFVKGKIVEKESHRSMAMAIDSN